MHLLSTSGLSKRFDGVLALSDVSFSLAPGEAHAICGENGAGKSTFVKLLMGILHPDEGTIAIEGDNVAVHGPQHAQSLGLGFVAQELSLAPRLSILDNIWLGAPDVPLFHRTRALRRRAQAALDALNVGDWDLDRPAGELSVGQRQIVEIARLFARDARILILDEPTATLTNAEIERILSVLDSVRKQGRSVIYVTHRLGEVFTLCDRVTVFRNGQRVATDPVAAMSRSRLVELMLGRSINDMYPPPSTGEVSGEAVTIKQLNVPRRVRDFSLMAPYGKIVCIAGQIGSGADTVTRALAGLVENASGDVRVRGCRLPLGSVPASMARNVIFLSEDRAGEGLFHQMPVRDNLIAASLRRHARLGVLDWPVLRRLAERLADRLGIDRRRLRTSATHLSGGNQQKMLFGRALQHSGACVLLMNEPTRGIDVGARADIYRLMRELCDQGFCLIVASSDLEEVAGIADIVVTMYRGEVVTRYERGAIDVGRILADIIHPAGVAGRQPLVHAAQAP
ncbi:MAG: sugar ABC transporter ATP-binding protein [Xanthobacteraceae bacterium]